MPGTTTQDENPLRLDLRQNDTAPWYSVAFLTGVSGYGAYALHSLAREMHGPVALLLWAFAIAFLALTIRAAVLPFERRCVYLRAARPPELVKSTSWFGKFTLTKNVPLPEAICVRARDEYDSLIAIEVEMRRGQLATIMCMPYGRESVLEAIAVCSDIARFLTIEDRGYHATTWP
jgi:hypothetical protein